MNLALISISEIFFFSSVLLATVILLYVFGSLIIKDLKEQHKGVKNPALAKSMDNYFSKKGYVVWNITPVKNSNEWLAFLVKNGEYLMATVFTNGDNIEVQLEAE